MRRLLFFPLALCLSACAATRLSSTLACPNGTSAMMRAELFFGSSIGPETAISDAAWKTFLENDVTPRFPAGLTVTDASGQWRDAQGRIETEKSRDLILIVSDNDASLSAIAELRSIYKTRFCQESVLLSLTPSCASF